MVLNISKGIVQRAKSLRFLLAAVMGRQSVDVTDVLTEQVRGDLVDGQSVPDYLASLRGLGQRLEATMQRLLEADMLVFLLKGRLRLLAGRRDALVTELAAAIVRLRRLVLALYEAPDVAGLALHSPRSYRSTPLLAQADRIVGTFTGESLETVLEVLLGQLVHEAGVDLGASVARVEKLAAELMTPKNPAGGRKATERAATVAQATNSI